MLPIYKREIMNYFRSPIGYVYMAAMHFFAGYYFFTSNLIVASNSLSSVFSSMFTICIFLIPILTMRIISEELKMGTDQLLLTAPVNLFSIVFGKYLAAFSIFVLSTFQILLFGVVISNFGTLDWSVIICNYIGLLLLGACLISIGVFVSSVTENQVISAVFGFGIGLFIVLVDSLWGFFQSNFINNLLAQMSFNMHYFNFTQGILDLTDVCFFVSIISVALFLTIRVFESKRW